MSHNIIFLIIVLSLMFWRCENKNDTHKHNDTDIDYTCALHPSVHNNSPGACPICNMSLTKIKKIENLHIEHKGNFITLDARQQLLAGIETDTVKFRTFISAPTLLGIVGVDEEQVTVISSRVKGRIVKLFVKSPGEFIQNGNSIYSIYSEELFADEKEFLALSEKKQQGNPLNKFLDDMLIASKNKLLLWGLTENQILDLKKNKTASSQVTFYSHTEGYVTELFIKEGMYLEEGTPLVKLAKLNQVWVEGQVYTNEKMEGYNLFQIYSETSPDEIYNGHLIFNNPSVKSGRKIQLIRIRVENTKNQLIPGMMVYVYPKKTTQLILTIPKSAVLLEKMKTVWVKVDNNTFEQRMVETGTENKYLVEITSGLKVGEIIVSSGAYLISSEFILKSTGDQRHKH